MNDYDDNGFGGSRHTSNAFEAAKKAENESYKNLPAYPLRDKCEEKAERMNIPHFTLLACDKLSLICVDHWLHLAKKFEVPQEKLAEAEKLRGEMLKWQNANPELCKIPD